MIEIEKVHCLTHPIRWRIVELLKEGPKHINAISKAMDEERRLVSYHLLGLEEQGMVTSTYEVAKEGSAKGKALRVYTLNVDSVNAILEGVTKI